MDTTAFRFRTYSCLPIIQINNLGRFREWSHASAARLRDFEWLVVRGLCNLFGGVQKVEAIRKLILEDLHSRQSNSWQTTGWSGKSLV